MNNKVKIFTPTKEKVIATVVVYTGLLLGSTFKVGFYWILFPNILFSGSSALNLREIFTFSDFGWNTVLVTMGHAIEALFIYFAVCVVIEKLSKTRHKII